MSDRPRPLLGGRLLTIFIGLSLTLGFVVAFAGNEAEQSRLVVLSRPGASIEQICERASATVVDQIPGTFFYLVQGSEKAREKLKADTNVLAVETDRVVHGLEKSFTEPTRQLSSPAMKALLHDHRKELNGNNLMSSAMLTQPALQLIGVKRRLDEEEDDDDNDKRKQPAQLVAVLDTGVDTSHPAVARDLLPGFNFITSTTDVDELAELARIAATVRLANSYQEGLARLNPSTVSVLDQSTVAVLNPSTVAVLDTPHNIYFGHGTVVTGLILLVAPDSLILPLKVFDNSGRSSGFLIAKAIRYAVDRGAGVINMSFQFAGTSLPVVDSLTYAVSRDVLLVSSAGNQNEYVSNSFPASFSDVVNVAATNLNDRKASFSNYGPSVTVSAPGDGLISAYPGGLYAAVAGTSFSSALVAGEAAALRQREKGSASAQKIRKKILSDVKAIAKRNPGLALGTGRIDVHVHYD